MQKEILKNICVKGMTGFIYLSFFLVQFNFHLSGTPQNHSYFTCDYNPIHSTTSSSARQFIHSKSRHTHFKLNKRFHPKDLFALPSRDYNLAKVIYFIPAPVVYSEEPLTLYSFNSFSLRGPPAVV